jgi:hypothetical protein
VFFLFFFFTHLPSKVCFLLFPVLLFAVRVHNNISKKLVQCLCVFVGNVHHMLLIIFAKSPLTTPYVCIVLLW